MLAPVFVAVARLLRVAVFVVWVEAVETILAAHEVAVDATCFTAITLVVSWAGSRRKTSISSGRPRATVVVDPLYMREGRCPGYDLYHTGSTSNECAQELCLTSRTIPAKILPTTNIREIFRKVASGNVVCPARGQIVSISHRCRDLQLKNI